MEVIPALFQMIPCFRVNLARIRWKRLLPQRGRGGEAGAAWEKTAANRNPNWRFLAGPERRGLFPPLRVHQEGCQEERVRGFC